MKSRRVFAGMLLLVLVVCWCGEASAILDCLPYPKYDPDSAAVIAGVIKGCWRAWNAPEGEKWNAFVDG